MVISSGIHCFALSDIAIVGENLIDPVSIFMTNKNPDDSLEKGTTQNTDEHGDGVGEQAKSYGPESSRDKSGLDDRSSEQHDFEQIVAGILAGRKQCEEQLAARFLPGLVLMLKNRTRDYSQAEDLAQETLVTVILRLRRTGIEKPHHLDRFMYQTAKFVHLGWLRKLSNRNELTGLEVEETTTSDIETDRMREEKAEQVRMIIETLPVERDRAILFRYYVNDEPKKEICEALDLSSELFDRVIHRARTRFKALVAKTNLIH